MNCCQWGPAKAGSWNSRTSDHTGHWQPNQARDFGLFQKCQVNTQALKFQPQINEH